MAVPPPPPAGDEWNDLSPLLRLRFSVAWSLLVGEVWKRRAFSPATNTDDRTRGFSPGGNWPAQGLKPNAAFALYPRTKVRGFHIAQYAPPACALHLAILAF